ncbi:hypothetical protein CR513_27867, partial [Mucuna pruriens]
MAKIPPYKHAIAAYGATIAGLPSEIAYGGWQNNLSRHSIMVDMARMAVEPFNNTGKLTLELSSRGGAPSLLSSRKTISISTVPFGSKMWKALARISLCREYRQFSHTTEGRREGSLRFLYHKEMRKKAFYLGDSSPVSSSPRTPCLNTVSNMPAVWYLSANALSDGKKPICKLIVMDIVKKQWDCKERTKKFRKMMKLKYLMKAV